MPRLGSDAKACTDDNTPERTRKVPSKESENAKMASNTVQFRKMPRFSVATSECNSAVPTSPYGTARDENSKVESKYGRDEKTATDKTSEDSSQALRDVLGQLKATVRRNYSSPALHAAGIEVILDVVFNHTGESDSLGPTLSLRGLDNASYYRLAGGAYVNDAGCGNILAFDRAPVVRLALDALRAFALHAGVDGFRFDLATTLARGPNGFEADAPIFADLRADPVLARVKLIAEPWDIGPGGSVRVMGDEHNDTTD